MSHPHDMELSIPALGGRGYHGFLMEKMAGRPFLALWLSSRDNRRSPALFLSLKQLSYVCRALEQIADSLKQQPPVLLEEYSRAVYDQWLGASSEKLPLNVRVEKGRRFFVCYVTRRSKQNQIRGLFIPQPDLDKLVSLLKQFSIGLDTWPGMGGSLKEPALPLPPAEAKPKPTLPPPPITTPIVELASAFDEQMEFADEESSALPDRSDSADSDGELFEELAQLESESTDWEALREEFDQETEQYAASEEEGWFYPDDDPDAP